MQLWSWWTDSNPRPADYKSAALPAELHQQFPTAVPIITALFRFVNYFFIFSFFFEKVFSAPGSNRMQPPDFRRAVECFVGYRLKVQNFPAEIV